LQSASEITFRVKQAAREAGFELSGISPVRDFADLDHFPSWIESGYAGDMKYMEARADSGELKRSSLRATMPWARSVIVCAINYNTPHPYSTQANASDRGWISRYAWSREDYHDAVLRRLRSVEENLRNAYGGADVQTRCYVDTGPLVERVYAKYAGVGWIGKNTCVLNQQQGSWLFLGVILTSLELTADIPAPDRCGSCTHCIDACPTNAFLGPYQLDATKCISYLTIEKKGTIPEDLREGMGHHVFGCDICQDVCPWNRRAPISNAAEFEAREGLVNPALEWLAEITTEEFKRTFRGSPIRRAKRTGLRRNAAIAMGNSGDTSFVPVLERLSADEDPPVAEHAAWALERLKQGSDLK
jgi:epoxyqueuosine reductase